MERHIVQLVLESATNYADIKIAFTPNLAERDCVLGDFVCGLESRSTSATFGTKTCPTIQSTRLFVEFSTPHFFLNPAPFDQLSEATNCFLNTLTVANNQLYHAIPRSELIGFDR